MKILAVATRPQGLFRVIYAVYILMDIIPLGKKPLLWQNLNYNEKVDSFYTCRADYPYGILPNR